MSTATKVAARVSRRHSRWSASCSASRFRPYRCLSPVDMSLSIAEKRKVQFKGRRVLDALTIGPARRRIRRTHGPFALRCSARAPAIAPSPERRSRSRPDHHARGAPDARTGRRRADRAAPHALPRSGGLQLRDAERPARLLGRRAGDDSAAFRGSHVVPAHGEDPVRADRRPGTAGRRLRDVVGDEPRARPAPVPPRHARPARHRQVRRAALPAGAGPARPRRRSSPRPSRAARRRSGRGARSTRPPTPCSTSSRCARRSAPRRSR